MNWLLVIVAVLLILWAADECGFHPFPVLAAIVLVLWLAGCAHQPAVVPARVVIPIECREPMPERPVMPTELLSADASVDAYVQAAAAEIDRREGYEQQLATALANCRKPVR